MNPASALLLAAAVSALPLGPRLKLGPRTADGRPIVLVLDEQGRVASRILCIRNNWVDPDMAAAKVISSREIMAKVIATRGHLTEIGDLGASQFECYLMAEERK